MEMLCAFIGAEGSNPSLSFQVNHTGEMAEWLKAPASKAGVPFGYRGFESLSLRFPRLGRPGPAQRRVANSVRPGREQR